MTSLSQNSYNALSAAVETFARDLSPSQRNALNATLFRSCSARDQLAALPRDQILSPDEVRILDQIELEAANSASISSPHIVAIMKATRRCNLRCVYCRAWRDDSYPTMSFETIARTTSQLLHAPDLRSVEFVWHGGEVTLLDVEFFLKAIWIQEYFRPAARSVRNSIQTNGVRLIPNLFQLFKHFDFSVGVSIDPPQQVHDRVRLNVAGQPTWKQVKSGLRFMKAMGIKPALLAVIGLPSLNLGARKLLESIEDLGVENVGLLNLVPENGCEVQSRPGDYVPWADYIDFLKEVFSIWNAEYEDVFTIRELSDFKSALEGGSTTMCYFAGNCMGKYLTIESDGAVAACDKYVGDFDYGFGTLDRQGLSDLLSRSSNLKRARQTNEAEINSLRQCEWFGICQGGCPHDRRLNRRFRTNMKGCCGYAPLLSHMSKEMTQITKINQMKSR